ncbi:MAG: hypothetical protein R3F11_06555 [Verrucomicrobiales bacterium]
MLCNGRTILATGGPSTHRIEIEILLDSEIQIQIADLEFDRSIRWYRTGDAGFWERVARGRVRPSPEAGSTSGGSFFFASKWQSDVGSGVVILFERYGPAETPITPNR